MPRRFRLGSEDLFLVPRRDLLEVHTEAQARRIADELLGSPGALASLRDSDALRTGPGQTDADLRAELVHALLSGALKLVRTDDLPSLGTPTDGPGDHDDPTPYVPLAETKSIAVSIVDYTGIPYAGLVVEVDFPDGHREKVTLDKHGRFVEDDVAGPGSCRIVFPSKLRLSDEDRRRTPVDGFVATDGDVEIPRDDPRPQSFSLGKTHRVVVQPPKLHQSLAFRGASFSFDSAFPTPGVASMLNVLAERLANAHTRNEPEPRFGLFGHCDPSGDDDYNKDLSDRRAKAIYALATGDADLFDEVADAEDWPLDAYQAMLRGLGNNPGPIDGEMGPMTRQAIAAFREEYGEDAHFDTTVRKTPRRHGPLDQGESLDTATKAAIRDAYHAEYCLELRPELFHGPKTSGCSEFNVISDTKGDNRRVTLAIWGDDAPKSEEFPCQEGDAGACTVDEGGKLRCRFYREHVRDPGELPRAFSFWDSEWTPKPSGAAHLSALTSLTDSDEVEFTVTVSHGGTIGESDGTGPAPEPRGPVLATLAGRIRHGVAFAAWACQPYDPFDAVQWFRHPTLQTQDRLVLPPFQPPQFRVVADGAWGLAGPPGHRLGRLDTSESLSGGVVALRNDGKLIFIEDYAALEASDAQRVAGVFKTGFAPGFAAPDAEGDA